MAGPPYNLSDDAERCQLVNSETAGSTSIEIQTQEGIPSAPTQWPATDGIAAIISDDGSLKEAIKYDSITSSGGSSETLTVGTRGAGTTSAKAWSSGDTIIHPISTLLLDSIPEQIVTSQGAIIRGASDGTPESFALGPNGQVLGSNGTTLEWVKHPTELVRRQINDLFVAAARSQFEDSLDELAYDGGFFDIFRDESKIASKTDVTVSTLGGGDADGKVELSFPAVGSTTSRPQDDDSRTESRLNGVEINTNTVLAGVRVTISANSSGFDTAGISRVSDGTELASKDISSLTAGDTFDLKVDLQSGTTYAVYLGSSSDYTEGHLNTSSFPYTGVDLDITAGHFGGAGGGSGSTLVPNVLDVTGLTYPGSGSFVSTQKDLGFVPSSVVISQDADIPADEDIQYVIRDTAGTPNTVTVTQAEVDTEVDVSSLTTQTIEIEPQLSSTDGADTPTLRELAAYFT